MLPVEAQITASAPSRTAAETAQVIPRSLNEPVGFAPSTFSHTSAPTRSDSRTRRHQRRRALQQRHDGIARLERQAVAVALDQADAAQLNSSSITRIARGGERMNSSCPISRSAP